MCMCALLQGTAFATVKGDLEADGSGTTQSARIAQCGAEHAESGLPVHQPCGLQNLPHLLIIHAHSPFKTDW